MSSHCHRHDHCQLEVKYCEKCNVCYCTKCGKEWKEEHGYTWWPYYTLTTSGQYKIQDSSTTTMACSHK